MSQAYNPNASVPQEIADMAIKLKQYMEDNYIKSIYGMGDIYKARREVLRELSLDHNEP